MSKKKKSKKTKSPKVDNYELAFEAGLDAEQALADSLCDQFLKVGVEKDAIDEAFVGAFKGFSHRMLNIFKKEFVFELVSEMSQIVDEEHTEHVCEDCQEKLDNGQTLVKADNSKLH